MPSRSSRRSSPRTSAAKIQSPAIATVKATATGKSSEWSEPPLQDAKPSFEDHGGVPFGVLEDMQPLGSRPGPKVKARAKEASRKSMLSKSTAGIASDAQDTPESTPALEASGPATTEPSTLPDQPLPIVDDEKDQDYMPRKLKKSHKSRLSRSAAKPNSSPAPATASPAPAPTTTTTTATPSVAVPVTAASPPAPTPKRRSRKSSVLDPAPPAVQARIPNLKKIVDAAVERSLEVGNPALGFALRELYNESLHDPRLASLLAGILEQSATPEETKDFREQINRHKKVFRAREEAPKNAAKKSEPAVNGSKKPHSPRKAAPPPELVPRQSIEAPAQLPAPKISLRVNFSKKSTSGKQSSSKMKTNDAKSGSQHHSRRASSSSLSSLTSNDDPEEDIMDLDLDNEGGNLTQMQEPPAAHTGDLSGIAVNNTTANLTVAPLPNGTSLKRSSAEAEMDAREKALAVKKQKLNQTVYRDGPTEESHIRPDISSYQTVQDPIVPPVQLVANSEIVGHREESPLTEVSISPPPGKGAKKKAKTKQS